MYSKKTRVAVGDVDEVVPAGARAAELFVRANRLHEHTRGVGGDAEGRAQRVLFHGVHDGGAEGRAHVLDPAAHRAAVDGAALASEFVFDAKERKAHSELTHHDVREQRRRRERARERLLRHRRGRHLGGAVLGDELVLGARHDEPP